jgi:hypothetical protein
MAKGAKTGGGSRAGKPNKATADIKALAQIHADKAIATLVEIMQDKSQPAAARVAASDKLLDRGFGKAKQAIDHSSSDGSMSPRGLSDFYAEYGAKPDHPGNA